MSAGTGTALVTAGGVAAGTGTVIVAGGGSTVGTGTILAGGGIAAGASVPILTRLLQEIIAEIIRGSTPGRKTNGRAEQYNREGGLNQANKDFDELAPVDVKQIDTVYGPGRIGNLSDGQKIGVRPGSSNDKSPTISIGQPGGRGKTIKIRYPDSNKKGTE